MPLTDIVKHDGSFPVVILYNNVLDMLADASDFRAKVVVGKRTSSSYPV